MTLVLREDEVIQLLDMAAVIEAVHDAMRELGEGVAQNQPRRRVCPPGGLLNVMFASYPGGHCSGLKAYSIASGGVRFLVLLFGEDGAPEALLEADALGACRTGAATAVAVRALAPRRPLELAVIGSGHQATTQVRSLARAVEVNRLRVYSRTPEKRQSFAEAVARELSVDATPAASADEAVTGADVVVCITTSREPVLNASAVKPGAIVVGAGSNMPNRVELPPELVAESTVIVDQLETAKLESGDLLEAERAGVFEWDRAIELGAVIAGRAPAAKTGRTTIFESHGLALWDLAAARTVVDAARQAGLGHELPLFSQ